MKKNKIYIFVGLMFITLTMSAQDINSPYSRFGLGQQYGQNVSTKLQSMGGVSLAVSDPYLINSANPASYASFDSATFVFQAGLMGNSTKLQNTSTVINSNYASLSTVSMGFPINKWWHMSLGVTPFSKTGYDTRVTHSVTNYADVYNDRWGEGGMNYYYIGNGFKLGKNLRLGVNANYLFGNSRAYNLVYFPDSLYLLGTQIEDYTRVGGFVFDWGLQYDIHFKDKQTLTLAGIYSNKINVTAHRDLLATTQTGGYNDVVATVKDTILYHPDEKGTIVFPSRYGFGLSFLNEGKWMVGADFVVQQWDEYQVFGVRDSLQNDWKLSVGGEYTPTHTSISKLAKRMTYRFGMRYNKTYLRLNGRSINEFAVSGGVKFPFKRSRTHVNLGFEIGSRGTLESNLIKETFFNFSFGINIVEHWFFKRKYR